MSRLSLAVFLCMSAVISANASHAGPDDIVRYDWVARNGSLMRYEIIMGWAPYDSNGVEDFDRWKPTRFPQPKNKEGLFSPAARIFCQKKCNGITPERLGPDFTVFGDAMEIDGVLVTWTSESYSPDTLLDGYTVTRAGLRDVFCASASRIDLIRKRGTKLTFQFTQDDKDAGAHKKPPVEHVLDLKSMRWENQDKRKHYCQEY